MIKDSKKKLDVEKLEKREAPFMPITYQDDSDGGGSGGTERNTVSRGAAEDVRNPDDGGGSIDRVRYDRPQR